MKNRFYQISVALNIIFLCGFLFLVYKKRERIYDKLNPDRTYAIVMLGTSLTGGCDWNEELKRSDIKTMGMGGASTFNLGMLLPQALHYKPKICFVEGGINDIDYSIPLKKTYENFEGIVDTLLHYNIRPVLQSALYCNHSKDSLENIYIDSINLFLVRLASIKKVPYIDYNKFLSRNGRLKSEVTTDGYHINDIANKIWAKEVKRVLKEEKI